MDHRLADWLQAINYPGMDTRERRDQALDQMRAAGSDTVMQLLTDNLKDDDPEKRCETITALVLLDATNSVEPVITMLADPEIVVRWHAAGCLHDFGDERAVPALCDLLETDVDPTVRGTAAYALGGIGSPAAIPSLLAAMDSDHEADEQGHTPGSCAATALDDILGTNETRIDLGGSLRQMASGPPDLAQLRLLAEQLFERWSSEQP
jgi:HEAT repeat protein